MLSPFQEQMKKDIENVFINVNELGKLIDFNGVKIKVVEDVGFNNEMQLTHGVDKQWMKIVCSETNFPSLPRVYESVVIDDSEFVITGISKAGGLLIITLEGVRL